MAKVYLQDSTLTNIGNAIRSKTGETGLILPKDMPSKISSIQGGAELYTIYKPGVREYVNTHQSGYWDATFQQVNGVDLTNFDGFRKQLESDKFRLCYLHAVSCEVFITKEMMDMQKPSWFPANQTKFKRYKYKDTVNYQEFIGYNYYPAWVMHGDDFTEFPWRDGKKNFCVVFYLTNSEFLLTVVQITDDTGNPLATPVTNPNWSGFFEVTMIREA